MSNFLGGLAASVTALLLAAVALAVAFLLPESNALSPPQTAVTRECVISTCMSPEEIQTLVGFVPLEPRNLPSGYVLYDRKVIQDEIPLEARRRIAEVRGVALEAVPIIAEPTTVQIEYRFQGRPFVPAITIVEIKDGSAPAIALNMPSGDCGEEVTLVGRPAYYGEGLGSVIRLADGEWSVCPAEGTAPLGNIMFGDQNVIVEVKVPLENLTRADALDIAGSM
jgi:hypothetical protein